MTSTVLSSPCNGHDDILTRPGKSVSVCYDRSLEEGSFRRAPAIHRWYRRARDDELASASSLTESWEDS
jgi:hypothetical protein